MIIMVMSHNSMESVNSSNISFNNCVNLRGLIYLNYVLNSEVNK